MRGCAGEPVRVRVDSNRGGWDIALPECAQPVMCETLDEARRVAYLCGAHGRACELIVRDERDSVRQEIIDRETEHRTARLLRRIGRTFRL